MITIKQEEGKKSLKIKIDSLGRLRLPTKLLSELNWIFYEEIEITIEYGKIRMKKFVRKGMEERPYVGIVRTFDSAYRIVIPKEFMDILDIHKKDTVDVIIEKNGEEKELMISK